MHRTRTIYPISEALTSLTIEEVKRIDQEATGGEGWEFYTTGFLTKASVFLNKISARVREAFGEYYVEATVDEHHISTACTCNEKSGMCKHAVALLYSWVFDAEDFLDVGETMEELQARDKGELIEIIGRIVQNDPRNVDFFDEEPEEPPPELPGPFPALDSELDE